MQFEGVDVIVDAENTPGTVRHGQDTTLFYREMRELLLRSRERKPEPRSQRLNTAEKTWRWLDWESVAEAYMTSGLLCLIDFQPRARLAVLPSRGE